MIVNIRGTGGAGKSTLVREVMARCLTRQQVFIDGRKAPLGYLCLRTGVEAPLFVPGSYENTCGGCDTFHQKAVDTAYDLVRREAGAGCDVLFEGIMVQEDVRRCIEVSKQYDVLVLTLDVPLEVCLQSIRDRRVNRGNEKPLNPLRTTLRAQTLKRTMERLKAAGVKTEWVTRETGLVRCCEELRVPLVKPPAPEVIDVAGEPEPFQLT